MREIRAADGEWLGVLMFETPPDFRHVNVAVTLGPAVLWTDDHDMSAPMWKTISLELAGWWEDGSVRPVWLCREPSELARARKVHVRGATCETKWGAHCAFIEAMCRLYAMVRFHQMPIGEHRAH